MQRGLWTGQYLNNTELSPNKRKKEGKEIPNQRVGESKKKRKEFPLKEGEKEKKGGEKKERKLLIKDRKKIEEMCREVFGPDNI